MKTITTLISLAALMLGCNNSGEKKTPPGNQTKTYELNSNGDTINRIDMEGRKQGVWITYEKPERKPIDTLIYKDGIEVK